MRGYVETVSRVTEATSRKKKKKENTLYFGCRSATKDQHYAADWENHAKFDHLNYRLAASRDGPEGVQRIYVQHLIEKDVEHVWDVVGKSGGWVYISG